jgi:hypothetical protein
MAMHPINLSYQIPKSEIRAVESIKVGSCTMEVVFPDGRGHIQEKTYQKIALFINRNDQTTLDLGKKIIEYRGKAYRKEDITNSVEYLERMVLHIVQSKLRARDPNGSFETFEKTKGHLEGLDLIYHTIQQDLKLSAAQKIKLKSHAKKITSLFAKNFSVIEQEAFGKPLEKALHILKEVTRGAAWNPSSSERIQKDASWI